MAKKKPHHAMHIKSRTQGSSNEISLSVLDATREARDAVERDRAEGATGKVSLFTLGKGKKPRSTPTKGQSIVLPDGAVPARVLPPGSTAKAARAEGAWRGIVPVVVVICVLLALALVVGQSLLTVTQRQNDLRSILDAQVDVIKECDTTLLPFDSLVIAQADEDRLSPTATGAAAPSAEELVEGYRAVVADIAPVRTELQDAIAEVEALQPSLSSNDDKEAAAQAVTAARSRLNMLDAGIGVIEESLKGTESFLDARAGWNAIIDADALAREATALMRDMTEENVTASLEKTQAALEKLVEARESLASATSDYPGLDLEPFSAYVAKRIEAQQAAEAADEAYLARNKEELAAQNDRYNALEEEAAALAQALEGDPEQLVADRFYAAIADDVKTYDAERLKAGNADAFLRDYLGNSAE